MQLPEAVSQSLRVLSRDAERILDPSELKSQSLISAECPLKVCMQTPEDVFQSLRVQSQDAERIVFPSLLKVHP